MESETMSTNLRQMIEALEEIAEQYGDDTQVLAAHQPNYPLAECISALVITQVSNGELVGDEDADGEADPDDAVPVVWVLLGGHPEYGDNAWTSPYASSALWDESVGESYSMN
jgi:hypothetical protein